MLRALFDKFIFQRLNINLLILLLFPSLMVLGQANRQIHGKVTDDQGLAIPNATVSIKGTQNRVSANHEGSYSIQAAPTDVMVFNSIGFQSEEVMVNEETLINVQLLTSIIGLQEVIVSYGKQREREISGSIAQVDATLLQDMPVMQLGQQLQGQVAGVNVALTSGQPGRGVAFRIRGAASFATDYQPLYVIDGLPITGSINNINPDEIESYTILKDASASALYGSRAANGVVLITTKHAKPGSSQVVFSSNYGIQVIPEERLPQPMNGRQWAEFMKGRWEDRVKYEGYTGPLDEVYERPEQYGEGVNWYKLLTQTAPIQRYSLTVQSARERSSSSLIAGYESQEGVIINTGTKLFSVRLNQDFTLSDDKLKIGFNIAPSYRKDHNNRVSTDGVNGYFQRLFEASPIVAPYQSDGSYTHSVQSPGMVTYLNPLAALKEITDDYNTTRILGNGNLSYEFIPGLTFRANLGVDKGAETRTHFIPSFTTSNFIATGVSSSVDNYSWTAEANMVYNKTFSEDHKIELLGGYSGQQFKQVSNSISGTGFPSDDIPYLSAATSISAGTSATTQYSLVSILGRLNYAYKGRYLVQGAIRNDGSSRFGGDRKYGYFPSVSLGWILSDELFMQSINTFDLLKLRASYGITGNNNIGNFTAIPVLGNYNYIVNGVLAPGQTIGSLGNSELAWERNKQFDVGLDLTMLDNRLSFTYDYYQKMSDGLIQSRPIPRASGFLNITSNIGKLKFWGHEFSLHTDNLRGELQWNTNFNISFERNRIISLVSPGFIRRNNTVTSDYYRNQEGHHLGEFYGFVFEGLYQDADDLAHSAQYGSASDIGTIKVKDINQDGVIDDVNDRTFIGDPTPKFGFGISNRLAYKSFDFNIILAGSVGGKILNAGKWAYSTNMDGSRVPLAGALDRWRSEENPGSGVYPRTKTGTTAIGRSVNSQWVEDGSFLTAKNITLGYTFRPKGNSVLNHVRVYTSIQQAFTISGYSGMNPEIGLSGLDATSGMGVDENAYPIPRTFSLGLSVTLK